MQLDALGIVSKNIPESIRFYSLLGLEFEHCEKDAKHVEAVSTTGLRVMLDDEELIKSIKPHWKKPEINSINMAFKCDSAKAVDECFKKVVSAGFKFEKEPWDAFWGQRYAVVLDPDGNSVDLFAGL
ncbi:hypothetical protein AZI86_13360 [Bdellovibrio bacteriovorus]|uniref:VOC domain-containing protein n=1 Tax=Bdellovibrio bacteriovorus TaxID=959 RepID=A0A150WJB7_BDEBC|nr:VOC family protein [Bdellovibrio bacteriovorus]KYG63806.1 hypothetical protein AZI86_13360 [Bdellovibrio bacteriovorus]